MVTVPPVPFVQPVTKNRRGRLVPRCGILGESTERLEYCSFFLLFTFLSFLFFSLPCLACLSFLFFFFIFESLKFYKGVFKILAKKKWIDHPSIHPSVNKMAGAPGTPWREYWASVLKCCQNPPLAHTNTGPTVQIRLISFQLGLIPRW